MGRALILYHGHFMAQPSGSRGSKIDATRDVFRVVNKMTLKKVQSGDSSFDVEIAAWAQGRQHSVQG
jgi:hypothetical protein